MFARTRARGMRDHLLPVLDLVIAIDLALFLWALFGRGLVIEAGGRKLASVTDIARPLLVFWALFATRALLEVVWATPEVVESYRRGRRRVFLRLATPPLVFFFALSLGEGAARMFRSRDREAGEYLQSDKKELGGPMRPSAEVVVEGVSVRTDAEGFRESEAPAREGASTQDPAQEFLILALGDSFTFGNKVESADTWPAQLERLLGEETGLRVKVVNGGFWGLNTTQEVDYLEKWVPALYRPRLVILAYVPNDAFHEEPILPADEQLYNKSYLWRFVRERILQIQYRRGRRQQFEFEDVNPGWRKSKAALARFHEVAASQSEFRPLVVCFPFMRPWTEAEDRSPQRILLATLDEIGLPALDLLPVYGAYDPLELQVEKDDSHPNARGYAIAVRAIADWIYQEGVLSRAPREQGGR